MVTPSRAIFLDRDGVLVVPEFRDGRSFAPKSLDRFRMYQGAAESARRLRDAGFKLIVVTNQPDVGAGLIEQSVVEEMHRRMRDAIPLDAIEVCYHTVADNCDCRKPKPGMLRRAAERMNIDCSNSIMVGDRLSDVQAGVAMGCKTIFVDLDYREPKPERPDFVVSSFNAATDIILTRMNP